MHSIFCQMEIINFSLTYSTFDRNNSKTKHPSEEETGAVPANKYYTSDNNCAGLR